MSNERSPKPTNTGWKELLTRPEGSQAAVLAVFFFAACLVLPLANDTQIATVFMLACVLLYYGMNHSLRSLLHYALPALPLILISELFPGVPNAMVLPCVYVALLVGGSTGAFLMAHFHDPKRHLWLLLLPAAAYGAAALLTRSPLRALLALLPLALALAAGLCLLRCTTCKDAVATIATALVALTAVALIVAAARKGALNASLLKALAQSIREHIIQALEHSGSAYAELGVELAISKADMANIATSVINIAPGLLLALCSISAFLLWRSLLNMLMAFHSLPRLPRRIAGFTMGRISAVVFLAAVLISLIAGATTKAGAVCENLCLALEPGLGLMGYASLLPRGKQRSCLSTVLLAALIGLLFVDIFSALTLIAAIGAVSLLTAHKPQGPEEQDNRKGEP